MGLGWLDVFWMVWGWFGDGLGESHDPRTFGTFNKMGFTKAGVLVKLQDDHPIWLKLGW